MTNRRSDAEDEAQRTLDMLRHNRDALGGLLARWFAPPAVPTDDPVELWGTRIGRGLSLTALLATCLYLLWAYFG
jgi:hypothetical protein